MSVLVVIFAIGCVAGVVHGGCQAGPGQLLLEHDDEYNEPLKPPIIRVVRDVVTTKVLCLEAYITPDDLGKGTTTNQKVKDYAKRMGYPTDQAGHLVATILGGTGYRTYNIVPQSRKSNTSPDWRTKVERAIRDKVRDFGVNATFIVEPQYNNFPITRPSALKYSYAFSDNTGDSGSVDNPKP